ncbi:KOW motif-containing protein [Patescibacteria group bacterium]|nr:KOW motif-containing protein [Patescibacteria group bacterium]
MQKIQTGDMVIVTTGQFKGKTAKVLKVSEQ